MVPFLFQKFFNQVLMLGKTSISDLSEHVFDLILELYNIDSHLLLSVLPQLEFKLKVTVQRRRACVNWIGGESVLIMASPECDGCSGAFPLLIPVLVPWLFVRLQCPPWLLTDSSCLTND